MKIKKGNDIRKISQRTLASAREIKGELDNEDGGRCLGLLSLPVPLHTSWRDTSPADGIAASLEDTSLLKAHSLCQAVILALCGVEGQQKVQIH